MPSQYPVRHFWILTLQSSEGSTTFHGVVQVDGSETAEQVYLRILDHCQQERPAYISNPVTKFWHIERNNP